MRLAWSVIFLSAAALIVGACAQSHEQGGGSGSGGRSSVASTGSYNVDDPCFPAPTLWCTRPPPSSAGPCYDEAGIVAYENLSSTVVKQTVCSTAQLNDYLKKCVLVGATQADCDAFTKDMANAKCRVCMLGDAMSTNPPALMIFATLDMKAFIYGNRIACQALVEGKPECGGSLTQAVLCDQSACQGCTDNSSFQECVKVAETAGCKDTLDKVPSECAVIGANGFDPKCDGKDFETIAANVVATICGM